MRQQAQKTVFQSTYHTRMAGHALSPAQLLPCGAPKAGTTSLYHYLNQHPQIYMSLIKEPCHFSTEIRHRKTSATMRAGVEAAFEDQQE